MIEKRGLALMLLPLLAGGGLLAGTLLLRGPGASELAAPRPGAQAQPAEEAVARPWHRDGAASRPLTSAAPAAARVLPPRRPVAPDIASAAESVRVRSTYQNYRTAAMTGDEALQKQLYAVLRQDRGIAMACARDEAEQAPTDADRAFALRTLDELGR